MRNKQSLAIISGAILCSSLAVLGKPQIGKSAIQTLAFPWGTRSLGMAETFTGIADNSEAIFYNPAGLGQTPLSKGWVHSFDNGREKPYVFTHITAKPDRQINDKEFIWASKEDGELYKFNGVTWTSYSIHLLDEGETVRNVAERFLDVKEYSHVEDAINKLNEFNGIGIEAREDISSLLRDVIGQYTQVDSLSNLLVNLPVSEQNETDILGHLFEHVPAEKGQDLASSIVEILSKPSEFNEMLELKIPFSIGPKNINALSVDYSGRLWAGTEGGLWRFDGTWKQFTTQDGIPNDTIISLKAVDETTILFGTKSGAGKFSDGVFSRIAEKSVTFPVTAIAYQNDSTLYLGSNQGIIKVASEDKLSKFSSKSGLLNDSISSLMIDSRNRIWAGHNGGVSLFNGKKWQQYTFQGSYVKEFAEVKPTHFWIATDKGAVELKEREDAAPEWKVYHNKNGLPSSEINSLVQFGKDTWIAHANGISQYKAGQIQAQAFFEQLLPSLGIDDIWHAAMAGVIPIGQWGALGVSMNYLYFGEVPQYDNVTGARKEQVDASYEYAAGLSYGLPITPTFSVGTNLKFAFSKLTTDAKARSISLDAGLLKRDLFINNLNLGFTMMNMGPAVYYDEEQAKDPIPFTLRYGMSYKPVETPAIEVLVAFDLDREIVYKSEDGEAYPFFKALWFDLAGDSQESIKDELQKIILHTGAELTYAQLISGRVGYMHDKAGSRHEMTFGMGLKTNIILADFGMIFALGENDIRNNQVRFSLTYVR